MNTNIETLDIIGEEHIATSLETPLREDAFEMDDKFNDAQCAGYGRNHSFVDACYHIGRIKFMAIN